MNAYDYKIHTQTTRKEYVKLIILDSDLLPLTELQGYVNAGAYNITNGSSIRRTCNITMTLTTDSLLPTPDSYFWIDKRFQLYKGIQNLLSGEIKWYNQGIYAVQAPSVKIEIENRTLQITGLDLASMQNGDISGVLDTVTQIGADAPIHSAIFSTIIGLGHENESRVFVENTPFTVPYDLEFEAGSTVWEIISKLTGLYMNYESFYDENGCFIFRKKSTLLGDPIAWDFKKYNVINAVQQTINYSNVKNNIVVRGKILENGSFTKLQPSYEIRARAETAKDREDKQDIVNNNLGEIMSIVNKEDSLFALDRLSETKFRTLYIQEDNYFNLNQCEQRAEYEYEQHNNVNSTVSLTVLPIYCLTVNQLIQLENPDTKTDGVYVINDISGQLSYDGLMTLNCSQVYN